MEDFDLTIDELVDAYYSLEDWQKILKKLVKKYGKNAMMGTDAGHNNVEFCLWKVKGGN